MKNLLFVIFVAMTAKLSWAQTQSSAPSKEWLEQAKKVVTTSNAWAATNAVVPGGISSEFPNDQMWEDILFGYLTHGDTASLHGDFELLDGRHKIVLVDTTLSVWVSDISVAFPIPPGVDVTGTEFLVPVYDDQGRIIKSYNPSGQGQDALVSAKKSIDESSASVIKLVNIEWVDEETKDAFFHEGRFYQKNGDKWETEDPDAPKVMSLGKTGLFGTGREQMVLVTKDADGVWGPSAMNVKHAPKRGLGLFAGYPLDTHTGRVGAYGLAYPVVYQGPMMGMGNNWGMGWNNSWGIAAGVNIGWGMGGLGCMPLPCITCPRYNMDVRVWNQFTGQIMPTAAPGGFYNDPYYGGWKSGDVSQDGFSDVASADMKSSPMANRVSVSNKTELGFVDVAQAKDLRGPSVNTASDTRSGVGVSGQQATAGRNTGTLQLGPSHGGRPANSAAKPTERQTTTTIKLPPSHTETAGRTDVGTQTRQRDRTDRANRSTTRRTVTAGTATFETGRSNTGRTDVGRQAPQRGGAVRSNPGPQRQSAVRQGGGRR